MRHSRNTVRAESPRTVQSVENFRTFLRGKSLRATSVREAIVKAVLMRKGHFHIEDLVRDLRARGVDASRATVYRALPLLVESGLIQPTVLSGKGHNYETAVGLPHHDHLVCSECDKVVEFQFEAFEILQREVAAKYGFELKSHFHELIGICAECRRRRPRDN